MSHWIDSPERLASRLAAWGTPPLVALDTEFVRERTFHPQLALVQLAVPGDILLVDPLAPGVADALRPLLQDPRITKLMHSAGEDLQALMRGCRALPEPLFDTQVAAAMVGLGAGLGYQKLVAQVTGVVLDKGETRSDWLRRPLSAAQLEYAADDVRHLHAIHADLAPRLAALGREAWLAADTTRALRLAADDGIEPWPHLAMRSAQGMDADAQRRLSRLLRWREAEARRTDRPRGWILDNELAATLARRPPADEDALRQVLARHPKAPRKAVAELWALLSAPAGPDEAAMPLAQPESRDRQTLKALQAAVAGVAAPLGLPEGLLCSRRHLEALLEGRGWPDALAGWRRELLEPAFDPILGKASQAPGASL